MRFKDRILGLTVGQLTSRGDTYLSGISTISSGTLVVSVTCAAINSGDAIFTQPYMYAGNVNTIPASGATFGTIPVSVRAGAFEISLVGSVTARDTLPVVWMVVRR